MARPIATRWRCPPDSVLRQAVSIGRELQHLGRLLDLLADLGPVACPAFSSAKAMFS